MIHLLLALALTAPICRDRTCFRARVPVTKNTTSCLSIDCGIASGDKSGNWWVLKADGTMLSGSSLTMSPAGSPGVSPLTFNGSTQWEASGNVAFPSTSQSFTVVYVAKFTSVATAFVVNKWPATTQTFICGVDTNPIFYLFNNSAVFVNNTDSGHTISTGVWVGMACTYNPGTGNSVIRYAGTDTTAVVGGAIQVSTNPHKVAGTGASTASFSGQLRGAFYTEKVLSDSDIDRIIAGAM